ncbi:MAG: RNA-binding protein [Geminicoccaceae bacterium]|nr:RNA-binding protein [Geminicoccaceae bacterium]MCS7266682.1 RNA-binding protein [Geminicoccaceae bacterium]MCX7631147.1 RNA-binding protein [Geminicoccaceae bacterium]MDW8123315.1 RNA-binding protein [Geminicoccaceae bacterium]MDW8340384.1 RNA-binding protein [Geminicoccaceae bacterium]
MSRKLFVANFPFTTTVEQLTDLFSAHGEVVYAKIATDRETGRSRGFGFIEMASPEQAEAAIRELDGYQMNGRAIAVRLAEERGPGGPQRGPRGPRAGGPGEGGFGGPRGGYGERRGPGGGFGGPRGPRGPRHGGYGGPRGDY